MKSCFFLHFLSCSLFGDKCTHTGESEAWGRRTGTDIYLAPLGHFEGGWGPNQGLNRDVTVLPGMGFELATFQSQPQRPILQFSVVFQSSAVPYWEALAASRLQGIWIPILPLCLWSLCILPVSKRASFSLPPKKNISLGELRCWSFLYCAPDDGLAQ